MTQNNFINEIWDFYDQHARRELPWRTDTSEYAIYVIEVMLQQTQVSRVIPKFESWMKRFPDWQSLANATLADVLSEWQGLGYNRRGKYLHDAAQIVVNNWGGELPLNPDELQKLPGIGINTAAAILVYAHNAPFTFIETNIRSVYIYHFFRGESSIHDKQLLPIIEQTLDRDNPREWYWALMDYGSDLKRRIKNPNRKSKHYAKQSAFEGSFRQVRSKLLKAILAADGSMEKTKLLRLDVRAEAALEALYKDGLIDEKQGIIRVV